MTHTVITHPTCTRGISAIFAKAWSTRVERRRNRKQMRVLAELDDHLLRDIGLPEIGSVDRAALRTPVHHDGW